MLTVLVVIMAMMYGISCSNIGNQDPSERLAGYEVSDLQVWTADRRQLPLTVYLATSKQQRAQGLSHVTDLPADHGMLFLFPAPQRIRMWMKDTPTSLDLLFIDKQGIIIQIVSNTTPNSTGIIASEHDAIAVLELNAGTARRLRIATGDRVQHAFFNASRSDSYKPAE